MPRIDIAYGSIASSKVLNDNFIYLEELVADLSTKMDSTDLGIDSKIATAKNTLQSVIDKLDVKVNTTALPIGSVIAWTKTTPPDGWIAMTGQTLSDDYAELKAVLNTDTLPDTRGRVLWGDDTPLKTIEAGLPNIEGDVVTCHSGASGAFTQTKMSNSDIRGSSGSYGRYRYTLNAKNSSEVYGNSTTVQPPAVTVVWIIKYRTVVTTEEV